MGILASVERADVGGGRRGFGAFGKAYASVETQDAVCLEDMHECAEHALGAIWGAGLKADLLGVSSSFRTSKGGPLPLLLTRLAFTHSVISGKTSRARTQVQWMGHRGREA